MEGRPPCRPKLFGRDPFGKLRTGYAVPPTNFAVAQKARCAIISVPSRRGCSSVVEHLLAKEDVASSSLVTRSISLRFQRAMRPKDLRRTIQ
jgi:hypothetical protein